MPEAEQGFFERNNTLPPELIEGILREKQIAVLGGAYGIGKSPLLADLTVCTLYGLPWCGRKVEKRPVIVFDFESSPPMYKANLQNITRARGVSLPRVPDDLAIYLWNDDATEPATKRFHLFMNVKDAGVRLNLIEEALSRKPNALILIDPVDLFFPNSDKLKGDEIMRQYVSLREVFQKFPRAAYLLTRNLRKRDRRINHSPNLLHDPRGWLEDIAGSNDILNRSDVRIGIDLFDPKAEMTENEQVEGVRVINGVLRGESFQPFLIQPARLKNENGKIIVGDDGRTMLAGFESADFSLALRQVLKSKQFDYWQKLPPEFRFEDVADNLVPRSSLWRILGTAKGVGAVSCEGGIWRKRKEAEMEVTLESMGFLEPGDESVND